MGRGRKPPATDTGRRSRLTPERADRIIEKVRAGNYLSVVARSEGIHYRTLFQWLEQGHNAQAHIDEHGPHDLPPQARTYARFAQGVQRARADAELAAVAIVQQTMTGGVLIEEEPVVSKTGEVVYGEDGPLMRRKWTAPDGKLALAYLQNTNPGMWRGNPDLPDLTTQEGLQDATAQTGENGDQSRAGKLAARIEEHLRMREQERLELEAGTSEGGGEVAGEDVVDAEVVEDA